MRHLALGLLLTASAGFLDAVGFIELGGYYAPFMSGNTTRIGADITFGEAVVLPPGLVAMFCPSSFLGSLIALRSHLWRLLQQLAVWASLLHGPSWERSATERSAWPLSSFRPQSTP